MCVGALVHARIGTLVYGAPEPRTGAVVSTVRGGELPGHNHRFTVVGGVREDECRALVQAFFRDRRRVRGLGMRSAPGIATERASWDGASWSDALRDIIDGRCAVLADGEVPKWS